MFSPILALLLVHFNEVASWDLSLLLGTTQERLRTGGGG